MEEYHSPFQLPEQEKPPKCTNPDDALVYSSSHVEAGSPGASSVWGKECPVHSKRKTAQKKDDPWLAWATYREAYATADGEDEEKAEAARELFMAKMLETVTATNPPDAKPDYGIWMLTQSTGTKINIWHDIDGRPHRQEVKRRILAIHWVLAASLVAWLALIAAGITLMGGW